MFDDSKIKIIQSMPEGDALLIIWIRLVTLGGVTNDEGYVYLSEDLPYTDEMLATIFNKPLQTIRLALSTFENLKMIALDTKGIYIVNFSKHQNVEKMNDLKEYNRMKQRESRERRKLLINSCVNDEDLAVNDVSMTVNGNVNLDIDIDKEKDKDLKDLKEGEKKEKKKKEKNSSTEVDTSLIVEHWNKLSENHRGISPVLKLTSTRRTKLLECIKEFGKEKVIGAISLIGESDFLRGDNTRGWVVDFSWFIELDNLLKVLEGKYNNREAPVHTTQQPKSKNAHFTTTYSHDWDLEELERREQERLEEHAKSIAT